MWAAIVAFIYLVAVAVAGGISQTAATKSGDGIVLPQDKCAGCRAVKAWWGSLAWWQQLLYGWLWYLIQLAGCALKGCP